MPKKPVMNILSNLRRFSKKLGLLCVAAVLGACTSIDELTGLPVGENIIIPFAEDITDWQEFSLDDAYYQLTMWQSPDEGFANSYSLSVGLDEQKTPTELADFRQLMDSAGIAQCDNYRSDEIYLPPNNRYPTLFWLFSCDNINGTKARILHLIMQGEDNFYHLQKNWQYQFTDADIAAWKSQFSGAYLCNTYDNPPTCPRLR